MTEVTPAQARHYINTFSRYTMPGAAYVDFPDGRIFFDDMTDEQAVRVAIGLMHIEAQAATGTRQ